MNFSSIDVFLRHLSALPAAVQAAQRQGGEAAGAALVEHARAMIGTEDERWAPLAPGTVAAKERKGQTGRVSATDPLYATGGYRSSFGHKADDGGLTWGSTAPVAPMLEHGTARMPPRPVVGPVTFAHGREAAATVAGHMVAAVGGRRAPRGGHDGG